jgi:hypothetical protein
MKGCKDLLFVGGQERAYIFLTAYNIKNEYTVLFSFDTSQEIYDI